MNTSDPSATSVVLGDAAPAPLDGGALAMASEMARLANQLFASFPLTTPASPFEHIEPSAAQVGAGGFSPALAAPPVPGPVQALPVANAPPPRDSDLRNVPAVLSSIVGVTQPVSLVRAADPGDGTPYFLGLAGHPGQARPDGSMTPAAPSSALAFPSPFPSSSPAPLLQSGVPGGGPGAGAPPTAAFPSGVPAGATAVPSHSTSLHPTSSSNAGPELPVRWSEIDSVTPGVPGDVSRSPGLFDAASIKRDFPILRERVHGRPIVWLDNAATTQKPQAVIDRLSHYYEHENSNVHRAAHTLAARASDAYEAARDKVRRFLNAPSPQEIVFVRGATEAINLVAQSWGRRNIQAGDEILITWLEHHANIVPWQQLCSEKGARLCVAPVDDRGQVILEEFERLLGPRTRLVSVTQVSNALGTIVPARELVAMAHRHGARVLIDGAQAVSHMPVDVQALDCDFYCFSGHKVFAPTGIGALFGKAEVLQHMPPWQGGGNMIRDVTFENTAYQPAPWKFEAGTGNIADAVGLGAALDYVTGLGLENIGRYEHELLVYATERLHEVPGLRLIGTAPDKAGVLSFVLDGVRTEEVGGILDQEGIAVRSGHHCAQPILRRFGLEATIRASLAPYNTCEDIDALVAALRRLQVGRPRER